MNDRTQARRYRRIGIGIVGVVVLLAVAVILLPHSDNGAISSPPSVVNLPTALYPTPLPSVTTTPPPPSPTRPRPPNRRIPGLEAAISPVQAKLPQAGVSIAEDPGDTRHLVAATNDYNSPQGMSAFVSRDGGQTWLRASLARTAVSRFGDPELAFGPHGVVYLAGTGYDFGAHQQFIHVAIVLFRSTDGGRSWNWLGFPSGPPSSDPGSQDDYPGLAVHAVSGVIYVGWTHFSPHHDHSEHTRVLLARSIDGGRHFSRVASLATGHPVRASVAVAGDGTAYMAFNDRQLPAIFVATLAPSPKATQRQPAPAPHLVHFHAFELPPTLPGLAFRVEGYARVITDPHGRRVYLVWSAWDQERSQVLISSSSDGGRHWSSPRNVDGDPLHHYFMPTLAVSPAGVLAVSFNGLRTGPTPRKPCTGKACAAHTLLDEYLALSTDCGARFTPLVRVTTVPSDLTAIQTLAARYVGDYTGLALDNHTAHPAWTDLRHGMSVAYTRAVSISSTASCR